MYRSPSTINASLGIQEFLIYASEITNYWFGNMIVIAVFTISLTYYLHQYGTKDFWSGCAVSSYFAFIISLLLWLMNVITGPTLAIVITGVGSATLIMWLNKSS